ncbi:MAG: hypothetical protein QGE99_04405 [SAR202 cluster bacterium]|nr:hypothetical protein [SAR202 cluster bacterium]
MKYINMRVNGKRTLFTAIISILILISAKSDVHHFTQSDYAVGSHAFSLVRWELRHLPLKWLHLLWEKYPGHKPNDAERNTLIKDYLATTLKLQKELVSLDNSTTLNRLVDTTSMTQTTLKKKEIEYLRRKREALRGRAEEAIESSVSSAARNNNLGLPFGLLIPPTDFRLGDPPHILITSRRDKIELTGSKLIKSDLEWSDRTRIEERAEQYENTSALVDDLAGLGTYPAIVSDKDELRQLMRTAAHEWLHNYWILKPLGRKMWSSHNMQILNETAADLAGNELGDEAFKALGNTTVNSYRYDNLNSGNTHLVKILRETRTGVEEMLENGEIEKAEQYMDKQLWKLKLGGYNIRKLNQAYFAFRGNYAEGPASISPIGKELRELRGYFDNVGDFIASISEIGDYRQFHYLLNLKRKQLFLDK